MELFIVMYVSGYEEFETVEKIFSRESLAKKYIERENNKRKGLGLRKAKYTIMETEVAL